MGIVIDTPMYILYLNHVLIYPQILIIAAKFPDSPEVTGRIVQAQGNA